MNSDDTGARDSDTNDELRADANRRPRILRAAELLRGHREVWIEHGDDMCRLRLTANGKLYLSK